MARSSNETKCLMCNEEGDTSCKGCSVDFCLDHLNEHRQLLNEQLALIQNEYNQFKENFIDMKNQLKKDPLIKQINQWEYDSIQKIKQKADECRKRLINHTNDSIDHIDIQLNETSQQFSSNEKQKKNFNDIHLKDLRKKLEELNKQLNQLESLSIEQMPNSFISEISIRLISKSKFHLFSKSFQIFSRKILFIENNFVNLLGIFVSRYFFI